MVRTSRSSSPRLVLVAIAVHLVLALVLAPIPAAGQGGSPGRGWHPPVEAQVADPFRPPSLRWSAGNRGLAYHATDGQTVVAVDDGIVSFAGQVGGRLHVTVEHDGGLRSTYAYVASIGVVRGQRIARGQPLATATSGFHLTARLGDRYIDPAGLLDGATGVPVLLPDAQPSGRRGGGGAGDRGGRLGLDRVGGLVSGVVDVVGGTVGGALDVAAEAAEHATGGLEPVVALAGGTLDRVARASGAAVRTAGAGIGGVQAVGDRLAPAVAMAAWPTATGAVRASSLDPLRALSQLVLDLLPSRQALSLARAATAWHRDGRDCTADDVVVPPGGQGRVLIQVGGLGTSDRGASIAKLDPLAVGYDPRDVVAFSYAGGCIPTPFGFDAVPAGSLTASLRTSRYSAVDTHQDLEVSARHLADLVEDVHVARPGAPIDLAAHSLGGVVARRALELLDERHGDRDVPVSVVLTVGSPHQGADLATASTALELNPWAGPLLRISAPSRAFEASATSVSQLARGTSAQLAPPQQPPDEVRVVSVAAPGDVVVPAERSRWPGAVNTIAGATTEVGLDVHGHLPARPEVSRELLLAVAGLPARCISFATAVGAAVVGHAVAAAEGVAAVGGVLAGWP